MLRIDLGCGTNKQTSFIGVDRYRLPAVDIIADMDAPLPFRDGSVDLLFASHSLEHVKTLLGTIREVYRICKHGSQLCVVAPYSEQKLNLANPYHTCVFNEHTPRFWTDYPSAPIDPEEYFHPHATQWGLSRSDHSEPGIDIRLVRLEYFYFPQYAGLPPSEQRRLRHERVDVCDQIMYHLIVWKGDGESPTRSFDDYVSEFQPYEPEYLLLLRNRGQEMLLQKSTAEEDEARAAAARSERESLSRRAEELTADLERYRTLLQDQRLDHHQQRASLSAALEESLDLWKRLLEAKTSLIAAQGEVAELAAAKAQAIRDRDDAFTTAARLAKELAGLRETYTSNTCESERLATELIALKKSYGDLHASETALNSQLTAVREDIGRLQKQCVDQTEVIGRLTTELHDSSAHNRILRDDAARSERELEFARADLRRESAAATASQEQASSLAGQVRHLQANLESNEVLRAKHDFDLGGARNHGSSIGLRTPQRRDFAIELASVRRELAAGAQDAGQSRTSVGCRETISQRVRWREARFPAPVHMVRKAGGLPHAGRTGHSQTAARLARALARVHRSPLSIRQSIRGFQQRPERNTVQGIRNPLRTGAPDRRFRRHAALASWLFWHSRDRDRFRCI